MPDILFDKLAYKDRLTRAGIAEDAARAHADALHEALGESVVTKSFLEARLAQLETRLTVRGLSALIAALGILFAALHVWPPHIAP